MPASLRVTCSCSKACLESLTWFSNCLFCWSRSWTSFWHCITTRPSEEITSSTFSTRVPTLFTDRETWFSRNSSLSWVAAEAALASFLATWAWEEDPGRGSRTARGERGRCCSARYASLSLSLSRSTAFGGRGTREKRAIKTFSSSSSVSFTRGSDSIRRDSSGRNAPDSGFLSAAG